MGLLPIALPVACWAPVIGLALGSLLLGRARLWATLVLVDALRCLGLDGAARMICRRAMARIERRRRALTGRRG